jgi:hypothetical protein
MAAVASQRNQRCVACLLNGCGTNKAPRISVSLSYYNSKLFAQKRGRDLPHPTKKPEVTNLET